MAIQGLTGGTPALSTVLPLVYDPKVSRAVNRRATLLSLLSATAGQGRGPSWVIATSIGSTGNGAAAATFSEGADINSADYLSDAWQNATLSWGQYRSPFALTGLEQDAAATSVGAADELRQLFDEKLLQSAASMASKINQGLYTGSGSNSIIGLDSALIVTGSYASINVATYTEVQSTVTLNGGTPRALTAALMEKMEADIYTKCGVSPNVLVMHPAMASRFKGLFNSFNKNSGNLGNTFDPGINANMLEFGGVPVVRDKDCADGKIYFLNTDYVKVKYLPQNASRQSVQAGMFHMAVGMDASGVSDGTSLPMLVEKFAKTGDADKFAVSCRPQLVVTNPAACGILGDLATT